MEIPHRPEVAYATVSLTGLDYWRNVREGTEDFVRNWAWEEPGLKVRSRASNGFTGKPPVDVYATMNGPACRGCGICSFRDVGSGGPYEQILSNTAILGATNPAIGGYQSKSKEARPRDTERCLVACGPSICYRQPCRSLWRDKPGNQVRGPKTNPGLRNLLDLSVLPAPGARRDSPVGTLHKGRHAAVGVTEVLSRPAVRTAEPPPQQRPRVSSFLNRRFGCRVPVQSVAAALPHLSLW